MRTSNNKVESFENRTNVTIHVFGKGNDYVNFLNEIHAIAKKHNAQENLYCNASHLLTDINGDVIGEKDGNVGGTITFHAHSCNHKQAALELVELMEK